MSSTVQLEETMAGMQKVKRAIAMIPGGRTMLFLYKRVHLFLRDGLLPDLQSKRWLRNEDEWVSAPQPAVALISASASVDNRPVKEAAEMFHYMMALQDELKGGR